MDLNLSPITSRDITLLVEIYNHDNKNTQILAQSRVPLNSIQNQDEYDIDLEMTEEQGEPNSIWVVKARIVLIWSYFKLYQDSYTKAENSCETFMTSLVKSNTILQSLTGINIC